MIRKKKIAKKRQGRFWQNNLSARNNQDIQRSHEEATMKKIVSVLCRRVSANNVDKDKKSVMTRHVTPSGEFLKLLLRGGVFAVFVFFF